MIFDYNEIEGDPQPYRPCVYLSNRRLQVIPSKNILYDNYYGEFLKDTPATGPLPLLYNISETHARSLSVKNQMGWFTFNNGDVEFLFIVENERVKNITEILIELNSSVSGMPNEMDLRCGPYTDAPVSLQ